METNKRITRVVFLKEIMFGKIMRKSEEGERYGTIGRALGTLEQQLLLYLRRRSLQ